MSHLIFSTEKYHYMAVHLQQGLSVKYKYLEVLKNSEANPVLDGKGYKGFPTRKDYLNSLSKKNTETFQVGEVDHKKFPDGEYYSRVISSVRGQHCTVIGGTTSDHDLVELYSLASTIVELGARSLTLIIPYFGYSTMERATKKGEVVGAKVRARLLSSIPRAMEGNRVLLLDLHTEGIPYYFEGDMRTEHVYAKPLIMDMIIKSAKGKDFVLGSTDAGRAKWVESLAKELKCPPAFVYKNRLSGSETQVTGVNADVKGKHVVIYDDMIRTGGSLIQAANAYLESGATSISAVTTHGIFPVVDGVNSLKKLADSKLFTRISFTDSYAPLKNLDHFFGVGEMHSVADIFIDYYEGYY